MVLHPEQLILFVDFQIKLPLHLFITAIFSLCLELLLPRLTLGYPRLSRPVALSPLSFLLALLTGLALLLHVSQVQGPAVQIGQRELGWLAAGQGQSLIQGLDHQTAVLQLSYRTGFGVCSPVRVLAAPGCSPHLGSSLLQLDKSKALQQCATAFHRRPRAGSTLRRPGLNTPRLKTEINDDEREGHLRHLHALRAGDAGVRERGGWHSFGFGCGGY